MKLGYFGKLTGQQQANMDMLEQTIRRLGRTTSFTSKEVAQSATELAQAGFSVKEINQSLQSTLDLARGTGFGLAVSAMMLAHALRTFNLDTARANEVVSQFVRATRLGTIGIEDLREALKYVSGTAFNLEQTLPTVLGYMVQLSESGLKGSLAGTSLNVAMLNLFKNLQKVEGAIPGFKLSFDQRGVFEFTNTLKSLFAVTKKMDVAQKTILFGDIFNIRGARAISSSQEIERVENFIKQIENSGDEARKAAVTMDSGFGGAIRRATSALDDLGKTLGQIVSPVFTGLLEAVAPLSAIIDRLAKKFPMLVLAIVSAPFALAATGAAFLTAAFGARTLGSALDMLLPVWKRLSSMAVMGTAGQMGMLGIGKGKKKPSLSKMSAKGPGIIARVGGMLAKGPGNFKTAKAVQGAASGLSTLIKSMWGMTRVAARFTFSWTGVWTIFEMILLFGHKIPAIAKFYERLGKGFSGAFADIARIGSFAAGPIKLFFDSLGLLNAGDGKFAGLGFSGMVASIQMLVSIVGNQFKAAWNQVLYAISPVYDFIRKIVVSLYEVLALVVTLSADFLGGRFSAFGQVLAGLGGGGEGWNGFFQTLVKIVGMLIKGLFDWLEFFGDIFDSFLYNLQLGFINLIRGLGLIWDKTKGLMTAQAALVKTGQDVDSAQRSINRKKALEAFNKSIDAAFGLNTGANAIRGRNAALAGSTGAANSAAGWIDVIARATQAAARGAVQQVAAVSSGTRAVAQMQEQRRAISAIVKSVGGSAHETRNQLLQKAITQEEYLKKQTEHLKSIDEGVEELNAKDSGGFK